MSCTLLFILHSACSLRSGGVLLGFFGGPRPLSCLSCVSSRSISPEPLPGIVARADQDHQPLSQLSRNLLHILLSSGLT
ncbi:hypothetical protein F4821DRAFT_226017 [Hypoxylon rubiginosum]|uniref:Uncharacterized protein n=1 Tax=Hypoxylon rubiginosum TaxID=110542 RepID=A0ACC0DGQ1_9PEZI|nr:hypothetical protein F4821DRAFT_226017 [Hypoxylon rubiginosum]